MRPQRRNLLVLLVKQAVDIPTHPATTRTKSFAEMRPNTSTRTSPYTTQATANAKPISNMRPGNTTATRTTTAPIKQPTAQVTMPVNPKTAANATNAAGGASSLLNDAKRVVRAGSKAPGKVGLGLDVLTAAFDMRAAHKANVNLGLAAGMGATSIVSSFNPVGAALQSAGVDPLTAYLEYNALGGTPQQYADSKSSFGSAVQTMDIQGVHDAVRNHYAETDPTSVEDAVMRRQKLEALNDLMHITRYGDALAEYGDPSKSENYKNVATYWNAFKSLGSGIIEPIFDGGMALANGQGLKNSYNALERAAYQNWKFPKEALQRTEKFVDRYKTDEAFRNSVSDVISPQHVAAMAQKVNHWRADNNRRLLWEEQDDKGDYISPEQKEQNDNQIDMDQSPLAAIGHRAYTDTKNKLNGTHYLNKIFGDAVTGYKGNFIKRRDLTPEQMQEVGERMGYSQEYINEYNNADPETRKKMMDQVPKYDPRFYTPEYENLWKNVLNN